MKKLDRHQTKGLVVAAGALAVASAAVWCLKKIKGNAVSELSYPEVMDESEPLELSDNDCEETLREQIENDLMKLKAFADWAEIELPQIDDARWHMPLGEGKWSLHEVLGHLYYWDRYSLETILPELKPNADLYFTDVEALNKKAWQFAGTFDRTLLLELFVATRRRLVESFGQLPDLEMTYRLGGKEATLHSYLKIFSGHDSEHRIQFEAALS